MLGQRSAAMNELDELCNAGAAIERLLRPRASEITPFGKSETGAPQSLDRPIVVGLARPEGATTAPQRAPHALRRIGKLRLQPSVERLSEQPFRLAFCEHAKQRIDACLNRTLPQQIRAEP